MISGVGLAIAKTIGSFAIEATISPVTRFGRETPIITSAPFSASARLPRSPRGFVTLAISACGGVSQSAPSWMIPPTSHITSSPKPIRSSSLPTEMPAAPAPFKTTRRAPFFRPVTGRR